MRTVTAVLAMGADADDIRHWVGGQEGVSVTGGRDAGSGRDTLAFAVADDVNADWVADELAGRFDVLSVTVA